MAVKATAHKIPLNMHPTAPSALSVPYPASVGRGSRVGTAAAPRGAGCVHKAGEKAIQQGANLQGPRWTPGRPASLWPLAESSGKWATAPIRVLSGQNLLFSFPEKRPVWTRLWGARGPRGLTPNPMPTGAEAAVRAEGPSSSGSLLTVCHGAARPRSLWGGVSCSDKISSGRLRPWQK